MLCEKAYYANSTGENYEKPLCSNEKNTDLGGKCPLIYWCSINNRYENTSDFYHCVYRTGKDNDFILSCVVDNIRQVINEYGEENFYISFSGGKDSCVLSSLIDLAVPGNNIPRVFADTGIELNMIRDFVYHLMISDRRIEIISPSTPIKTMLQTEGYPFKSKIHSHCVNLYQTDPSKKMWQGYTGKRPDYWHTQQCPKKLLYQFTQENKLRISDMCCFRLKEEPLINWAKQNGRSIAIVGILADEGGRRRRSTCLSFRGSHLIKFQPLVELSKKWEEWFIDEHSVTICNLYSAPYNFKRTGCKGCPFGIELQHELDVLEKFFPNERKQCERIWKPVYNEYRRIGYRLKQHKTKE